MRAPTDEAELWDAFGARVFAFCQRVLGDADLAADATQDAFLLAQAEAGDFGRAVFRAARVTCFELLGRRREPDAGRGHLSVAAARLRPQQRAALALGGLEAMTYAEVAAVLGVAPEGVPALFARARLRLHDELHGTALASAAVRSPDCEDVLPLLAAAVDGELQGADATWADPHVERCSMCPRSIRAMAEAVALYAAWSPAIPPVWLGAATLAEVEKDEAALVEAAPPRGRVPAAVSAALVGATLATAASATLLVSTGVRNDDTVAGGARLAAAVPRVAVLAPAREHHGGRAAAKRARPRVAEAPPATAAPAPRPVHRVAPRPQHAPVRHQRTRPAPAPAPAPADPVPASASEVPSAAPEPEATTAVAATAPVAPAPPAAEPEATSTYRGDAWGAGKYRRRG